MAIQTQQLSDSMPRFAPQFRSADAKGSSAWQIVQWRNVVPANITPDQVIRPDELTDDVETVPNRFDSRTQALRYSKVHVRRLHPDAVETGHWGVWKWIDKGSTNYQSVAPQARISKSSAGSILPEQKSDTNSSLVRVSAETNRRLREIAAEDKTTFQSVIDAAVKDYYRMWFFRRADAAYDALRTDGTAWAQELAERKLWDTTLLDGIDCNEEWQEDGTGQGKQARAGNRG